MSSSGQSSRTSADLFEDLWRQLRECQQNARQELEAKVTKLKKERYLDAQRLEVFHSRTQQLKEQNKTLQDAIILLEERLREGGCDRCAILKEDMKNNQDQNLRLIAKLTPEQVNSPEQEEGVIPDSPIMASSLPVANKLKKRKNIDRIKHVRYAEMPLPKANNSLFSALDKEHVDAVTNPGRAQVLVPNTCELDTTEISNDVNVNLEDAIAETCGLELIHKPRMKNKTTEGQQSSSKCPRKYAVHLKPYRSAPSSTLLHSPDSTSERSQSLLPCVKRFSEEGSVNKAKRKKEESVLQEKDQQGNQEGADTQNGGKLTSTPLSNQSFKQGLCDSKVQSGQNGTFNQKPSVSGLSPVFKKPDVKGEANKNSVRRNGKPQQDLKASHNRPEGKDGERKIQVEPMWSMDPALTRSMYDTKGREEECPADLVDTDRTWVSHSLLLGRGENAQDRGDSVSGLGGKANDSLDMMFDTTACGEYNSHLGRSQPCGGDEEEDEEEGEEEEDDDPHENTMSQISRRKARGPAFAHMAVVRKKDERRKLKGTTCKECDVVSVLITKLSNNDMFYHCSFVKDVYVQQYYAHLPEDEKEKKLSACSRHRFLYIPPCTPENFWEVGFPSTQTCIDRGRQESPGSYSEKTTLQCFILPLKQNQEES
ncbi:hypothetical protein F7725_028651 [Dissostichus mawsoni]|uniref:DNA endonuclease RBBP8 n=1 Tax=Dissostichus mawsoni TaxID=36200 RepID=A0A7J5XGX8_DISMA|nr:hypothetical protein F7725_028651 [Dissostichus mawsoni]